MWQLILSLPAAYPSERPVWKLGTKNAHENVNLNGRIN
jgi:ubiquitin-protein ligase